MLFFHAVCHSFEMICVGEALMICLVLSSEDRAQVEQARRSRPQIAERCHYVLLNAEGWSVPQIAQRLDPPMLRCSQLCLSIEEELSRGNVALLWRAWTFAAGFLRALATFAQGVEPHTLSQGTQDGG